MEEGLHKQKRDEFDTADGAYMRIQNGNTPIDSIVLRSNLRKKSEHASPQILILANQNEAPADLNRR